MSPLLVWFWVSFECGSPRAAPAVSQAAWELPPAVSAVFPLCVSCAASWWGERIIIGTPDVWVLIIIGTPVAYGTPIVFELIIIGTPDECARTVAFGAKLRHSAGEVGFVAPVGNTGG